MTTLVTKASALRMGCPVRSYRGSAEEERMARCAADCCMAWRWAPRLSPKEIAAKPQEGNTNHYEPMGFCGLAPQV